jgi:hypothetical protein
VRFEYEKVEGDLPNYEPIVRVHVIGPHGSELIPGVLDMGSVETVIPYPFMAKLGIAEATPDELDSIAGHFTVWYGQVDLALGFGRIPQPWLWSATVAFAKGRDFALWGRLGFLEYFVATFDGPRRYVKLRSAGEFPPPMYATRGQFRPRPPRPKSPHLKG